MRKLQDKKKRRDSESDMEKKANEKQLVLLSKMLDRPIWT